MQEQELIKLQAREESMQGKEDAILQTVNLNTADITVKEATVAAASVELLKVFLSPTYSLMIVLYICVKLILRLVYLALALSIIATHDLTSLQHAW